MALYFSPSTGGFYSDDLHGDSKPTDVVRITAARHRALLDGQSQGREIIAMQDGRPGFRPVARPAMADVRDRLVRRVKQEAARRIEAVSPVWRQLNDARIPSDQGASRFAAIDAIRAASAIMEQQIASASKAALETIDIADHDAWPTVHEGRV